MTLNRPTLREFLSPTTSTMPYQQPYHARYSSVDSTTSPCSPTAAHQPPRPSSVDTIVAAPSPTFAASPEDPNAHWRFHYIDLDTMYPSISPTQMMPDLRALGLEVPRRPSFESAASIPWETVKREHDVTGRSSPSSSLQAVTTSVVSHVGAWRLEIAGLVLALVAVACLGGVVARFDGEALAEWPSRAVTLNAVVAVLVTVGTAGMSVALASGMGQMKWVRFKQGRAPLSDLEYYDEASRGAWGGLGLLFRMRGGCVFPISVGLWEANGLTCRCRVTGSFGAMIMVLAVFMSPFAQQIVAYRFRTAMVDSGAVSWRALGYDLAVSGNGGFLPVMSMKAAVYDGLLSGDSEPRSRLPVECATGNCTFGEIETLAVCQSCVDMSAFMTRYCVGGTPPGGDMSKCGWQLPSGAVLNTSADVFSMTPLVRILIPSHESQH